MEGRRGARRDDKGRRSMGAGREEAERMEEGGRGGGRE